TSCSPQLPISGARNQTEPNLRTLLSTGPPQSAMNPFALLDKLHTFVLQSTEEKEKVLSILGVIFYLNGNQDPTLDFLTSLLDLELQELTLLFWDLHSIVHILNLNSSSSLIDFYHASFCDYCHKPSRDLWLSLLTYTNKPSPTQTTPR
ncbi:hypothetical protein K443DRAFT_109872, partial [Laccaria amethystina LaAM-08-1]